MIKPTDQIKPFQLHHENFFSKMNSTDRGSVFLIVLCLVLYLSSIDVAFETCSRYTSFGYGYRDFFEFRESNFTPNQVFYLEFYVKTSSDAHILLKPDVTVDKGYEIVIGGGSNTFSQIRLLEPEVKKTMITQKTDYFLSEYEYREFWISIDKLGIISVGKKENDEVFINWRFDDPMPIRYFSFGSWTNMKADWRFGCTMQKGNKQQEVGLSPERQLKRDLFTLYDPNALPVEKRATLEVKVNFQIHRVQLDEKRGELTIYGTGDLKWMDAKMKWKPEDYTGIENIYVPPFQIWTPSIRVLNALASDKNPLFDLTAAGVMVKYDGSIFWRPPFKSVSHCTVNLKYWPYDVHNCTVLFGFWMEPSNLVLTVMDEYETLSDERTDSGWEIVEVIPFNTNHPDEDDNFGILYVELRRASGSQVHLVTLPYIAAVIMIMISFWLPLQSPMKLYLICGSLTILLLTLFLLGLVVPAMTESVPRLVSIYSWSFNVTCIPIILYVILKNIHSSLQIPEALSRLLDTSYVSWAFCLPDSNEMAMEYSNFNDEVNKLSKDRINSIRLLTIIERLFFLVYLVGLVLINTLI